MGYRFLIAFGVFLLLVSGLISLTPNNSNKISDNPYNLAPIQRAYLLGDKKAISRKLIKIHKELGIMHFMTPSGLHLSTLLIIVSLIIRKSIVSFGITLILLIILGDYTHLDSFKRMCLFTVIKKNPLVKINNKQSFILTFTYYFIQGQYFENPLSFSLSFLFLSILVFSSSRKEMITTIILIQMLISFYFGQSYYLLGSLYGLMLTFSSIIIFPLILLEAIFSTHYFTDFWIIILKLLNSIKGPELPSFIFFLFITLFFIKSQKKLKVCCIIISIFIPLSFQRPKQKLYYSSPPPKNFIKRKEKDNKITFKYLNGLKCKSRFKIDRWYTRCKK